MGLKAECSPRAGISARVANEPMTGKSVLESICLKSSARLLTDHLRHFPKRGLSGMLSLCNSDLILPPEARGQARHWEQSDKAESGTEKHTKANVAVHPEAHNTWSVSPEAPKRYLTAFLSCPQRHSQSNAVFTLLYDTQCPGLSSPAPNAKTPTASRVQLAP